MNAWLENLANMLSQAQWLAPILALAAGVLTSFTPCSLSGIPLVIGYVGGTGEKNFRRSLMLSLAFAVGSAITFTALGVAASVAGRLLGNGSSWWYLLLGILMVLMALQTWEVFTFIPSSYLVSRTPRQGMVGAVLAGILAGIFSSPCSTPVLVALLAIVAGQGSMLWGIVLLLCYSAGHSVLAVVAGTSVGFVQSLSQSKQYGMWSQILKWILGASILLVGLYMFYLGF
ncbi:MAG: cytochrome c biogenesis CcdA family protein [Eubacteriales bacterium]|jgi:cytochrome c-type biogenesis protein